MNLQQVGPPRSSANGFNWQRADGTPQSVQLNFNQWFTSGDKGEVDSPPRERLVYLTTCLIGHQVEVQVNDGSVYSGVFHATNAEKDFGIILKMACMIKGSSSQEQKNISNSVNKGPSKTLIIPSKDLVQIVAKSLPVTRDGFTNEFQHEKQQDIMTDSSISRSRHVELERELEPWVPDDENIECPELDNTFDRPWNRGWDQFETNAALFGVTSTFDEELYTTKLDRGPMMKEREKEALRLAREIEGEDTQDLHLAEERGIHFHSGFDLDEETKYSSVFRGVDDSGYDENEDIWDSENIETFGNVSDSENRIQDTNDGTGKHMLFEHNEAAKSDVKKESSEKGLSADATAYAPSNAGQETVSCSEVSKGEKTVKIHESTRQPASSPGLSPSSSMGSLSSEKSTLNPNAKEFRLNPNAKGFVPLPSPLRAQSPVPDGSFYYPNVSHMQGASVGIGMGTSFAPHQSVVYSPQTTSYQSQPPYFQPNVPPQYGQQMLLAQPRQMAYIPNYPPEMPYKGRDF
ncbi:polyadenylate-binding protein-interacting protein 3-like [Bidens hawaiensis]|uniref:polyadenylate-binding protein-interacting protein 3-like n=1 Tax=Bidens hawaiensis TaxID=980011 RepID=UPI004049C61D